MKEAVKMKRARPLEDEKALFVDWTQVLGQMLSQHEDGVFD